ncbi:helicase-related protein [Humibacter ginsengiterrae]
MGSNPFFLVAATGLGKTVVVPVHVWLVECTGQTRKDKNPTIWIVEPRVLIAEDQARYMEATLQRILRELGHRSSPPIFGYVTSSGAPNRSAPIKFVTTGVFTIKALSGDFDPDSDRIVIDEAHETIAQNPDVELAVAVARRNGVHIDYMSATVDTRSIPRLLHIEPDNVIVATKKRFPIFASNAGRPMMDCLAEIIDDLLVKQNHDSRFLPPKGYPGREQILADIFEGPERSHALLVALNTVSSKISDFARVQQLLANISPAKDGEPIAILELSGKQTGSEVAMALFDRRRTEIEDAKRPYIVLATSVIEMGVTIPALDFVVTMDSGFQSIAVGDRSIPEIMPLPFNSLKQRLGRVGRRRAGVGIITREVGAPYTDFDIETLNSESIEYEPVKTPLATSQLGALALHSLKEGWSTPAQIAAGLRDLQLPSEDSLLTVSRLKNLVEERRVLISLGATDGHGLSALGEAAASWISAGWLPYAFELERAWRSGAPVDEVSLWLVSLALSDLDLGRFLINNASFEEFNSRNAPSSAGISFIDNLHAPLGRYDLVRAFFNVYAGHLVGDRALRSMRDLSEKTFSRDCVELELSDSSIRNAMEAVADLRAQFAKRHRRDRRSVSELLGPLPMLSGETRRRAIRTAHETPGQVVVRVGSVPNGHPEARAWVLQDGRPCAGAGLAVPNVDSGRTFTARLRLRREADRDGFWLDVVDHWVRTP